MPTLPLDDALLEKAARLSAADLHEAAGQVGALPSLIKPLVPSMRLTGRALPVCCPDGDNLLLHHAIYRARPGDVLLVDTGDGREFGYWGEIMAAAAQRRGLGGLVITGGVRDSLQIAAMGFSVFAGAVCIRGTRKDPRRGGQIGAPLRLGEVTVHGGDLVVGDADGVVVVPAARAAEAVATAEQRQQNEASVLRRIGQGESTISIFGLPDLESVEATPRRRRRSIEVAGLSHGALPIPAASRLGGLVATGGVRGVDPATGEMPDDLGEQICLMFENLSRIIDAAGGSPEDILKVTIWTASGDARPLINGAWVKLFPDASARPARHVINCQPPGRMLVQCEALAVVQE